MLYLGSYTLQHLHKEHHHESFVLFKTARNNGSTVQQGCRSTLKKRSSGLMSIMDQTEHLHSSLNSGRTSTERLIFVSPLGGAYSTCMISLLFNLYDHSNSSSIQNQPD